MTGADRSPVQVTSTRSQGIWGFTRPAPWSPRRLPLPGQNKERGNDHHYDEPAHTESTLSTEHPLNMRLVSPTCQRPTLEQDQRQPQREQQAHDDDGDEAHRAEGLALNIGDAEQETDAMPRPTYWLGSLAP